jgi:23S rRNA (uridine2552-2'-O)-methyltransferase
MFNPQDFYFKKAKKEGYKARSIFKLEEIDKKFHFFDKRKTVNVLDIGCAPGSWLQYVSKVTNRNSKVIWLDLKEVKLGDSKVKTYVQDATDFEKVSQILKENGINKLDIITSDMAPNTIGFKDIDAIRSLELIKSTLPLYEKFLKENGKFVIKIFMWPWFDEFIKSLKDKYWWKNIKTFKPESVRKISKEIYVIKI